MKVSKTRKQVSNHFGLYVVVVQVLRYEHRAKEAEGPCEAKLSIISKSPAGLKAIRLKIPIEQKTPK